MGNHSNTIQSAQSRQQLADALSKNDHSLVVMSPEEFFDFAVVQKKHLGFSHEQIMSWLDSIIQNSSHASQSSKQIWSEYQASIKNGGSYLPVLSDSKVLAALALEMRKGGHLLTKYRINSYGGRNYIVLKGYAGLRNQLTGTRYLASNPKVVSMGIGKLGAANAIKGGVVISIVFSVAFHSLDQLMNDKATWHDFVAGVAIDVASATAGAAIAWGAVSAVVGATAMAAIGPIALVVVVGAGITTALNVLGEHYDLTNELARLLKISEQRMVANMREIRSEVRRGLNYADEDPIGFMHRLFGVPYIGSFK